MCGIEKPTARRANCVAGGLWLGWGGKRGAPMQPLWGWRLKPRFVSQGGFATLGFVIEPRCGSRVFDYPAAHKMDKPRLISIGGLVRDRIAKHQ